MVRTRSFLCLCLTGIVTLSGNTQEAKDGINLQVVKYDGLKDMVLKNRGKVVLVDFWGVF
jgi:hypothetical protein